MKNLAEIELSELEGFDEQIREGLESGGDLGLVETRRIEPKELVREIFALEEEDLLALRELGPEHTAPSIQHIRAFHKVVALKIALGEKPFQICASLAITPQTITRLQKDPQFVQLVDAYQEKLVEKAVDLTELMGIVGFEALTALHEKLTGDERESISIESLRKLGVDLADRTGYSPIRRTESTSRRLFGVDDATLDLIKAARAESPRIVEGELVRSHEEISEAAGATASLAEVVGSLEEKAPERTPGEGEGV